MPLHVVLVEPEIHANAGNVARTCAATGAHLHLVMPLGFSLDDRKLRRAGLDYWPHVVLYLHETLTEAIATCRPPRVWYTSSRGRRLYSEVRFGPRDMLVFGRESTGLPQELLAAHAEETLFIPTSERVRSLNLANAVAIVVYEALRQQGFPGLPSAGSDPG